jgi:hypothetical protein
VQPGFEYDQQHAYAENQQYDDAQPGGRLYRHGGCFVRLFGDMEFAVMLTRSQHLADGARMRMDRNGAGGVWAMQRRIVHGMKNSILRGAFGHAR